MPFSDASPITTRVLISPSMRARHSSKDVLRRSSSLRIERETPERSLSPSRSVAFDIACFSFESSFGGHAAMAVSIF